MRSNLKNSQKDIVIISIFLIAWCYISLPLVNAPWLTGYDSLTRIYNIDKLLVDLLGNIWLPLYQFILRSINLLTENIMVFKYVSYFIAIAAMISSYFLAKILFSRVLAISVLVYFLIHVQWIGVSTSLYMEPLFILNITLALIFYSKQKNLLFSLFFILATFSRPELVVAAPTIVITSFILKRDLYRILKITLLYIPIIVFYLCLKLNVTEFDTPNSFRFDDTKKLLSLVFDVYLHNKIYIFQAILVFLGIYVSIFKKINTKNIALLRILPISILIFIITYTVIIPFFHNFSAGGTRKSLYILIISFLYVGAFFDYLLSKNPEIAKALFCFLLGITVTYSYYSRDTRAPSTYKISQSINTEMEKKYDHNLTHYYCKIDSSQKTKHGIHPLYVKQVLFYLRSYDWKMEEIDCSLSNNLWKTLSEDENRSVLKIYDIKSLKSKYIFELERFCYTQGGFRVKSRTIGRYCF